MNYTIKLVAILFILSLTSCSQKGTQDQTDHLKLWYNQPATDWQSEALPIGNGFMGTMFFGGIEKEQIQFAEGTLWSGGPGSGDEYNYGIKKDAWKHLAEVRRLLDEGKMDEAHELANRELTGSMYKDPDSKSSFGNYGAQQTMGDLFIEVKHEGEVSDYIRELDIENAEGRVSYTIGDTQYSRTYFASYPSKTMIYRFESNTATDYSLTYKTPHIKNTESFSNATYSFQGHVEDNGMEFETRIKFETDGTIEFKDGELIVSSAKYVNMYHAAATDYTTNYPTYKGNDYVAANIKTLENIEGKSFDALRTEHQHDFSNLFDRVELDLGDNKRDSITTGKRLFEYSKGLTDAGLEELYFQYSRYLMISASRPGSMPLNLQGKWNNSTNPAWANDYHMNINQQMLYWPAEVANLSECHVPLFDYMETLVEPGRISAKEFFNTRGWIVNTMNNPFGYTSPGWNFPWGFYPGGAGWLCQHLWEQYEFTQDKKFLKETAYPMMKEAALFWIDYLIEDENGYLVSSPSYSPEHGGISRGASMDHQIAWDLLNNSIAASEILGVDEEFRKEAKSIQEKIAPPTIGSWGQLQEWKEDVDDPKSKHRHVSHLYAFHPGKQISVEKTPDFAEAAKVSLNARGDDGTGWSLAWKVNFWSRLKDGERAYKLYRRLLQPIDTKKGGMIGGTYTNLLCGHPPFQLDGNMGGAAGMAEMLLQSHTGSIELLPALPAAWKNGSVKGLKARGGFEVSVEWRDGKLVSAKVHTVNESDVSIKYGNNIKSFRLKPNQELNLDEVLNEIN
ncbi:glycoside hydrolase family 95 protein [Urechidicola vernalis]|uniref:Glycoside hydrolase N-terminal domain-containing protein n=1 Tax=Urechidicola vernalis TaxID=3075600 RepID=A0ABU2Y0Z9_9FLAO|nr:glycoside hydrolase N-terminal domain-containing protein [Urechidicola sp. P050]MDT0551854.1 glycoside hydrolase N-terminal domain-containing protein [Urechidicola sp. P050]